MLDLGPDGRRDENVLEVAQDVERVELVEVDERSVLVRRAVHEKAGSIGRRPESEFVNQRGETERRFRSCQQPEGVANPRVVSPVGRRQL